jgi:flagellar motor protein MotB
MNNTKIAKLLTACILMFMLFVANPWAMLANILHKKELIANYEDLKNIKLKLEQRGIPVKQESIDEISFVAGHFDSGSTRVIIDDEQKIRQGIKIVTTYIAPNSDRCKLLITGHTDDSEYHQPGGNPYLSFQRAVSALNRFSEMTQYDKREIDCPIWQYPIVVMGLGEDRPIATNRNNARSNRRVEMRIKIVP